MSDIFTSVEFYITAFAVAIAVVAFFGSDSDTPQAASDICSPSIVTPSAIPNGGQPTVAVHANDDGSIAVLRRGLALPPRHTVYVKIDFVRDNITITEGTTPGIPFWIGPSLGNVPINMRGEIRGEQLYFIIDIKMENSSFGELINVEFGDGGYQIKNSGFEEFHTATAGNATSDEPNAWHSFMSCTGDFASMVSSTPHTFISEDVRPGSTGSKSVAVVSGIVFS